MVQGDIHVYKYQVGEVNSLGYGCWRCVNCYGCIQLCLAQEAAANEGSVEKIAVTGSRIRKADFVSNAPVATIGQEQFNLTATDNTESLLNTLPQVVPGLDRTSNNPGNGTATVVAAHAPTTGTPMVATLARITTTTQTVATTAAVTSAVASTTTTASGTPTAVSTAATANTTTVTTTAATPHNCICNHNCHWHD